MSGSRIFSFQGTRFCRIATHFSKRSTSLASFMISWTRVQGSSPSISRSISDGSYCGMGSPAGVALASGTAVAPLEGEVVGQLPEGSDLARVAGRELHRAAPHREDRVRHVLAARGSSRAPASTTRGTGRRAACASRGSRPRFFAVAAASTTPAPRLRVEARDDAVDVGCDPLARPAVVEVLPHELGVCARSGRRAPASPTPGARSRPTRGDRRGSRRARSSSTR